MPDRPLRPRRITGVFGHSKRRRRSTVLITGVVTALLAVSGCLGIDPGQHNSANSARSAAADPTSASPSTSSPPPRPAPAPRSAVCRRLTYREIGRFSNDTRTVRCRAAHTAYTYAVNPLPRRLADALDSDQVQGSAQASCERSFESYVGGTAVTRATTRLTMTYFLPRARDFANGTRWVRCDLVALLSPKKLAALPTTARGILDKEALADRYAVCARGRPGTPSSVLVMCTEKHSYRAVTALRLGGRDVPLPTHAQLVKPKATCRTLVGKLLGVDGGFSFVFTYPDQQQWNDGQRFGLCWNGQST